MKEIGIIGLILIYDSPYSMIIARNCKVFITELESVHFTLF